jgi:hypothetical protein
MGICYFSPNVNTDNEKMVRASQEISLWNWPSRMHDLDYNRSQLREYWTICLSIVSKYILNTKSDHANVTLALLSQLVSVVLLFSLASRFLSEIHSLMLALFYATMMWPYYISIYAGHILLSQAFFLGALLCFVNGWPTGNIYTCFLSGILISASFFSSSASRKYPILFVLAISLFVVNNWYGRTPDIDHLYIYIPVGFIVTTFIVLTFKGKVAAFLTRRFQLSDQYRDTASAIGVKILVIIPLVTIMGIYVFRHYPELSAQLVSLFFGVALVFCHIMMPRRTFFQNVKRYGLWLNVSNWASHFDAYPEPLKTFGHKIEPGFKGGGWVWLHRLLLRMCPEIYVLWGLSIFALFAEKITDATLMPVSYLNLSFIVLISVCPALIHYLTGGLRVGKAMFSCALPMLLPVAVAVNYSVIFEAIFAFAILLQFLRTCYLLHTHLIPCRMAATNLRNMLRKHGVKQFYTFETTFNDSFTNSMLYTYPNEFEVKYVNSVSEIDVGFLVVPPTSAKSVSMETQQEAIIGGDFRRDLQLDDMIESQKIEPVALEKIPTLGTSRYFAQESEVTSYLDLMLGRISKQDYFRGNGWLVKI